MSWIRGGDLNSRPVRPEHRDRRYKAAARLCSLRSWLCKMATLTCLTAAAGMWPLPFRSQIGQGALSELVADRIDTGVARVCCGVHEGSGVDGVGLHLRSVKV